MRGWMKKPWTELLAAALAVCLVLPLFGCSAQEEPARPAQVSSAEAEQLAKLCRVWGYVKYTHPVFLLGQRDWDQELLELIPQVRELETEEDVNTLLHKWFVGLGEIDYGEARRSAFPKTEVSLTDISWTANTAYLGEDLVKDLEQLADPPYVDRSKAPMQISGTGWDAAEKFFGNEGMPSPQYEDPGFRLLGLFRLWNAIEYYFPYKDYLDQDWKLYLEEYIPRILEGTDRLSYEMAIATLAFQLHDPHVWIEMQGNIPIFSEELGFYFFPVPLTEAEGQLVVSETVEDCPLERGDILLSLNGSDMEQLIEERKQYECYPREDAVVNRMRYTTFTRSQKEMMDVTVQRGKETLSFTVKGRLLSLPAESVPQESHQLLESGIGLIRLSLLGTTEISEVMDSFRDTKGLIVDLRQYPEGFQGYSLSAYLQVYTSPFLVRSTPSQTETGVYTVESLTASHFVSSTPANVYHYDKPVVVLMNNDSTGTQSNAEYIAAMLSLGKNVVLMGENSAGAGGGLAYLPLPGNLKMAFSIQRVTRPDGECWFQTGLTPDIPVYRTIQGVKEGRDEVMEAAIAYIQEAA